MRNLIQNFLEAEGHEALCVSSSDEAFDALRGNMEWDLLLLDVVKDEDLDRLFAPSLLQRIGIERVCLLTEIGDTSWKVQAKSWGINRVLSKPFLRQDLEKLISESACSQATSGYPPSISPKEPPSFHLEELDDHGFFLAGCPAMMQLHKNIGILATVDYPVLILGESGVGKEVVARLLHKYHVRSGKKFVNVNTAAIPSELLESELFGYEAGAFTGAVKAKPGSFELADQGTLLLDEIGEMSLQMQAKLLHVLQDGSFSRLGARSSTHVDVRILAATNVNIEVAINEKRFREDLYYRISAFTLVVPSLRDRREEIPLLIEQMINRGSASAGREPCSFSNRLIEAAQEYHWPGNLRELRNFVTRLLVLQDQDSAYEDLRRKTQTKSTQAITAPSQLGMKGVVNDVKHQTESRMIKEALTASGWNRRRAASNLNISYRALLYKIQQHGLSA
ncbi:sigma-54-dependent transcriptional regulator [Acidicapsa ligni]|uniref:sigma-54-dependent transcriptional regulator n=1 Tax=Acidicapsa ligni TaxID=542300 RepID=UPI0021DF9D64|nr:sigma-54 dependent transcriptional regulator [Acidicapsa ligni]